MTSLYAARRRRPPRPPRRARPRPASSAASASARPAGAAPGRSARGARAGRGRPATATGSSAGDEGADGGGRTDRRTLGAGARGLRSAPRATRPACSGEQHLAGEGRRLPLEQAGGGRRREDERRELRAGRVRPRAPRPRRAACAPAGTWRCSGQLPGSPEPGVERLGPEQARGHLPVRAGLAAAVPHRQPAGRVRAPGGRIPARRSRGTPPGTGCSRESRPARRAGTWTPRTRRRRRPRAPRRRRWRARRARASTSGSETSRAICQRLPGPAPPNSGRQPASELRR